MRNLKLKNQYRTIVITGFNLLQELKGYPQSVIVNKFKTIGIEISNSSFNNIINQKEVGIGSLRLAQSGIISLVTSELGYKYDQSTNNFIEVNESKNAPNATTIPEYDPKKYKDRKGFLFHENGRPTIQQKVHFLQGAQKEIIEFGLRLRTFTDYFYSRNESEFARPIKKTLQRGVNLKLYLINPDANEARLYFQDIAKHKPDELESLEIIKRVIKRLKDIQREINELGYPGKIKIYTYKHIPQSHYLIIDGATPLGKMMVTHYLYGIKRADCPMLEVSKQYNYELYNKYYRSFKLLTKSVQNLEF